LALRLKEMIIHDNRKRFGRAAIRVEALVVRGINPGSKRQEFYEPRTFRFERVKDGERLPIGDSGLLLFFGRPQHFLDFFLLVSRDRQDSAHLAELFKRNLKSDEIRHATAVLLGLAIAAPTVASVAAAVGAAAAMGSFAVKVLFNITGDTIGLYRSSYLQNSDSFGLGRHPVQLLCNPRRTTVSHMPTLLHIQRLKKPSVVTLKPANAGLADKNMSQSFTLARPKSRILIPPSFCHEQVLWLEIAMRDSLPNGLLSNTSPSRRHLPESF
jgi:hypothetical protein